MNSTSAGQLDSYNTLLGSESELNNSTSLQLDPDSTFKPKQENPTIIEQSLPNDAPKLNLPQQTPSKKSIENSAVVSTPVLKNPDDTIAPDIPQRQSVEKKTNVETVKVETPSSQNIPPAKPNKEEAIALVPGSSESYQSGKPESTCSQDHSKVSAYARLEFENFIFFVQTLQVVLGRKSENDQSHSVDVHLGPSKAISRKHAKIFYNFGTERFELSIQGKNGAFVGDAFIERGATVPLINNSKIQIGQIVFRFVLPGMNPQESLESPSKPINPSDAISLRSTLYTNHSNDGLEEVTGDNSQNLTSKDFQPVNSSNHDDQSESNVPKSTENNAQTTPNDQINTTTLSTPQGQTPFAGASVATSTASAAPVVKKPREKKPPRPPKPPKKVYTLEEIPEEYRTKPACSYSNLIATCLRTHGTPKGMSLAEIYKSIREIFPYYKYCPDGWQSSVRHNLSLNKAFRKVSKEGKGWLWGLDEEYCAEKERQKKKQQEAAAAKAKAAQLKLEQQQQQQKLQQQRLEQQKQLQMAQAAQLQYQQQQSLQSIGTVGGLNQSGVPLNNSVSLQNIQTPLPATQGTLGTVPASVKHQPQLPQLPRKVDPSQVPKFTSTQSQPQTIAQPQPNPTQIPVFQTNINTNIQSKTPSIQAQLAANRATTSPGATQPAKASPSPQAATVKPGMNADTKKALTHLQSQLVILSKDLRNLVDKPTISQILTQAIAMTIAQVTQAAKTKGITTDPLATLIDTNPSQLTRILTVALNAATYKVTNGRIKAPLSLPPTNVNSGANSRAGTPVTSTSQVSTPMVKKPQLVQPTVSSSVIQLPAPVPVPAPAPAPVPAPVTNAHQQVHIQDITKSSEQPQQQIPLSKVSAQPAPSPITAQVPHGQPAVHPQLQAVIPVQPVAQNQPPPPSSQPTLQAQAQTPSALISAAPTPVQPSQPQTSASIPSKPKLVSHPISQAPSQVPSQISSPVKSVASPAHPQSSQPSQPSQPTQPSQSSQASTQSFSVLTKEPANSSLQPTPASERINTVVPVPEIKPEIVPQPQPSQSSTVKPSVPLVKVRDSVKLDQTSNLHPSNDVSDSSQVASANSNVRTNENPSQKTPEIKQEFKEFDLRSEVKPQAPSETKPLVKTEKLNFDDLNDPEFDKVLRSLSKEGTPASEGDNKVMNDEELNRLLSEDFTSTAKPPSDAQTNNNNKRTFEEVDPSQFDSTSNKLPKIDQAISRGD